MPLVIAYFRSEEQEKAFSRYLAAMVVCMVFFGLFVDMLNIMLFGAMGGVIEDGGEMIVMSVMLWFMFRHSFEASRAYRRSVRA